MKSSKKRTILISILLTVIAAFSMKYYFDLQLQKLRINGENKSGKTIICKTSFDIRANNTYMIISQKGKVVVIDPYDVIPGPNPDLITVSHLHGDHYDEEYVGHMQCKKSISKVEGIELDGIKMLSFASSHEDKPINYSNPTNVIYYYEIDSLRIAHLGDFGQNKLTEEQKTLLHGIDVLIMPCQFNPVTEQSINNILDDIQPSIIFTTHMDSKRFEALKKRISSNTILNEKYVFNKADLKNKSLALISLERNNEDLLFVRYLVYKFTGSPLFKIILGAVVLIIVLIIVIAKRRKNI